MTFGSLETLHGKLLNATKRALVIQVKGPTWPRTHFLHSPETEMRDRRGLRNSPTAKTLQTSSKCPVHPISGHFLEHPSGSPCTLGSGSCLCRAVHGRLSTFSPSGPHARDATFMSTHMCTCPQHVCALQTQLSFPQAKGECTWKVVTKLMLLFLGNVF